MTAFRVGDVLELDGRRCTIRGFLVGTAVSDPTAEFAVVKSRTGTRQRDLDRLDPRSHRKESGSEPCLGVDAYEPGAEWHRRFTSALAARHGEPDFAREALETTSPEDDLLVMTGGAIRDALLGEAQRVGDLDLAGTMLPPSFRELVAKIQVDSVDGRLGAIDKPWNKSTDPDGFVTVTGASEAGVEYASWRLGPAGDAGAGHVPWLFGTSLREDADWRDVTINTLSYDPTKGVLYDPTGNGLKDLGLVARDLENEPDDRRGREVCIRPIDIPANAPAPHAARHVDRLVKTVARLADRRLDLTHATAWVRRYHEVVGDALSYHEPGYISDRPMIERTLSEKNQAFGRSATHVAEVFGEHWPTLKGLLKATAIRGTASGGPRIQGPGLRRLAWSSAYGWEAQTNVIGPSRPTALAVARYFGRDLVGYEHALDDVRFGGTTTEDALVLRPSRRLEEPWFVELDQSNRPRWASEQELATIREGGAR